MTRTPARVDSATTPGVAVRVAAARVLTEVLTRGQSLRRVLATTLPGIPDPRDRALLEAICFTGVRAHARHAAALAAWMPRTPGPREGALRAVLSVGFAQLELGLPAHAAVTSTVEAARVLGRAHQAGLVNALLRRAQREGLPATAPEAAWPAWLREALHRDWPEDVDAIVAASACEAPLWLRVNRRRTTREALRTRWHAVGVDAEAPAAWSDALCLPGSTAVVALPGFAEGEASVQDAAAQAVADALAPAPGARVLDACAAPGGKAAHLLERDPSLQLLALDRDPARLPRVAETLARLGLSAGATLRAADAGDPAAWWDGIGFDAILLDVPCTATGIVRRQPDVLLHRRERDLAALLREQARLLDALWPLLRPGGRLLYTTCSILAAENNVQIRAFLERHPEAWLEPLAAAFGRDTGHGHQRLPGEHGMDGFFYARLLKPA